MREEKATSDFVVVVGAEKTVIESNICQLLAFKIGSYDGSFYYLREVGN